MPSDASSPQVGKGHEMKSAALGTSWLWLAASAFFLLFANGRNNIAMAPWLAPVLLLRFVRGGSFRRFLAAYCVVTLTWAFQFRGMVPVPQPVLALIWLVYGLAAMLPFIVDRVLTRPAIGFQSTLVFPCAATGLDYLVSLFPYGSWGSPAYTQFGNLPLMQLVSVTGIYGITFMIAWFAAVAVWVWEKGFDWPRVRRGVLTYAVVFGAVLFFGGERLASRSSSPTVRVASLTQPDLDAFQNADVAARAISGRLTPQEIEDIRHRSHFILDNLFSRAALEADAGARIVFWGEGNSFVLPEDEPALMARASQLASQKKIYLGLGNMVWHYGHPRPLENTIVLFDPNGAFVWKFLKAHPVPGGEAAISMRDDGKLKFVDSPYGRISSVICFDADSVQLLHQAGAGAADLVIIPSNDWPEIDPWHSQMAAFRAVEQGFNMIRHVSRGLSLAIDNRGRVLGAMDHYQTQDERTLVAEVPTRGVRTIYSRVSDIFSWLALACLALFGIAPLFRATGMIARVMSQ